MDPKLDAMLHGEGFPKKNLSSRLEQEIDKEIDAYVDGMEFDEDPSHAAFQNVKAKRESMKLKIKEEMKMPELAQFIDTAMEILYSEGEHFLSKEANQAMLSNLRASNQKLADIGLNDVENTNLQTLADISNESMKAIFAIALGKFKEGQYPGSLALFSLLTLLNPGQPEFWFRLGIAAQTCDKIELASRAYAAAIELDPNHVGARLFAAECFLNRNLNEEAKAQISEAKKIIKDQKVDQTLLDFLSSLEDTLKIKA